jgi:ATP-dependent protease ClpP protease subunit
LVAVKERNAEHKYHHRCKCKGKTFEELSKDMERDNFMSAQEAVDYGLADEIITKR